MKSEAEDIETCSIGSISRLTDLLLTINVSDSHQNPKFPPPPPLTDESLPPRQPFISDFTQLTDNQVQKGFVVELAAFFHLNRKHFEGEGHFRSVVTVALMTYKFIFSFTSRSKIKLDYVKDV